MPATAFRIVILEDNPADLYMIQQSIREAGIACEFIAFDQGNQAIAYIEAATPSRPDLMILDFNVPGIEGVAVLNRVREQPSWKNVGVFMFTASRDPGDMVRATALGADRCLSKPMDLDGFLAFGKFVAAWLEESHR